jgi:hypothetical protein
MTRSRQSEPDFGLGIQVKDIITVEIVSFSLGCVKDLPRTSPTQWLQLQANPQNNSIRVANLSIRIANWSIRVENLSEPATDEKVLIERKVPPVVMPPFGDTCLRVEG